MGNLIRHRTFNRYTWTCGLTVLVALLLALLLTRPAQAQSINGKSGVAPQVISLPTGPGSLEGIGEAFEPDLSTGTARYSVNLTPPPGRTGFAPLLALTYDGGQPNSPWGLAWKLSVPAIQRQTDKGLPTYDDGRDAFTYGDGEKLVRLDNGDYRTETEKSFMRFRRLDNGGWEAVTPAGIRYLFGENAAAREANSYGIFRWRLERQTDTHGNEIHYFYQRDSNNGSSNNYKNHCKLRQQPPQGRVLGRSGPAKLRQLTPAALYSGGAPAPLSFPFRLSFPPHRPPLFERVASSFPRCAAGATR